MELKVADNNAIGLNESLGISKERNRELLEKLDNLRQTSTLSARMQMIAGLCDTLEEYTTCIVADIKYLVAIGVMRIEFKEPYERAEAL